jgi:hypothetical protein
MPRLLVLVSLLVAFVTIAPLAAFGQEATPEPGTAAATRTDIRYVLPFGPDGLNTTLTVAGEEAGTCISDSLAALDRPDAFDCTGESGQIYDPCFENPFLSPDEPAELACVTDPFSSEVVVLTVEDALPREKEAPAGPGQDPFAPWDLPWGLELANGDRCTLLGGTLYQLAGQVVHYSCEQNGAVLGVVDHGQPLWTVNYLTDGDVASNVVDVTAAWS